MSKTWVNLSESEKIEDLRKDVEKIFNVLNALISDVRSSNLRINHLDTKMSSASEEALGPIGQSPKA